jgi:hypothetical protein
MGIESCDCCGRSAGGFGANGRGFVRRAADEPFAGTYCLDCASLLRLVLWSETCRRCGAHAASESAAERDGWRYFVGSSGRLVPCCAVCAASEYGIAPPAAATARG